MLQVRIATLTQNSSKNFTKFYETTTYCNYIVLLWFLLAEIYISIYI